MVKKSLEFDQQIDGIFTSRSTTDYGYVALIGKMKFTIYYIYDDNIGGCDYQVVWSKDYRFDRSIRAMGQIISLDFEQQCVTFITGTAQGWICIWDLQEKRILRRIRVVNPETGCFEACNLIRNMNMEKNILSCDATTKNLFLITTDIGASKNVPSRLSKITEELPAQAIVQDAKPEEEEQKKE